MNFPFPYLLVRQLILNRNYNLSHNIYNNYFYEIHSFSRLDFAFIITIQETIYCSDYLFHWKIEMYTMDFNLKGAWHSLSSVHLLLGMARRSVLSASYSSFKSRFYTQRNVILSDYIMTETFPIDYRVCFGNKEIVDL